jgi:flagellar biosynthesis/type III secretory pathway protein FliH
MHPDDAAAFATIAAPGDGMRVVPDGDVRRGGCRIEHAGGVVEAGFDLRLGEARDAIG